MKLQDKVQNIKYIPCLHLRNKYLENNGCLSVRLRQQITMYAMGYLRVAILHNVFLHKQ